MDFDDIANCPFLKDKVGDYSESQISAMRKQYNEYIKPNLDTKINVSEIKEKEAESNKLINEMKGVQAKRHPRLESYQASLSSCPFLNSVTNDPKFDKFTEVYNMELKDKYEIFYAGRGELSSQEWGEKRAKFNNYALCVKHSLIQDEKWHKLHNSNFSATFYISDELKTEGNLYYEDGNYNEAITLYEQGFSCHKWLEIKDAGMRDIILKVRSLDTPLLDEHISERELPLNDECEEECRLIATVSILKNLIASLIQGHHLEEAKRTSKYLLTLTDQCPDSFFLYAASLAYHKLATITDLNLASLNISIAISKKPQSLLYIQLNEFITHKLNLKINTDLDLALKIIRCAHRNIQIKARKGQITNSPIKKRGEKMLEIKIIEIMKKKYSNIVEFYINAENLNEVEKAKKEYQSFMEYYDKIMKYYKFSIQGLHPEVRELIPEEFEELLRDRRILWEIEEIREREGREQFARANFNIELFQHALAILDDIERERLKKRKKEIKERKQEEWEKMSFIEKYSLPIMLTLLIFIIIGIIFLYYFAENHPYLKYFN